MSDIEGNPTPLNVPAPQDANGRLIPASGVAADLERTEAPPGEPVGVPGPLGNAAPYDVTPTPGEPIGVAGPPGSAAPYGVTPPPAVQVMPFIAGLAPVSIDVTPANTSIHANQTLQFVATATYADGSQADVTQQVAWTSSDHSLATFSPDGVGGGLVTGHNGGGAATIAATLFNVSGSTLLTVLV